MANVMQPHPQIGFHPGPVKQAPSPFGFGFGLSSQAQAMGYGWSGHALAHPPQSGFQPASAVIQPSPQRSHKRRHEPDDDADDENRHVRDHSMDRSPTPERPKRGVPKRARVAPTEEATGKTDKQGKENKSPGAGEDSDVDVGVLLASLPPQSLLPLLTSMLNAQPALKPLVLSLIPRPTLETATQALAQAARKLRDAYPYSNSPFSQPTATSAAGFGSGYGSHKLSSSMSFGFGSSAPQSGQTQPSQNGGMRDSYILSRLRPHIHEFVTTCLSYLPYFSYIPVPPSTTSSNSAPHSNSTALQSQHKDKCHPSETFTFLSTLTTHILSQPQLAQSSLSPMLLTRLTEEWKAWVDRVDEVVNREGGMFGGETVRQWERGLDEFAEAKGNGFEVLRVVRDNWVQKVGWLVGRSAHHPMEEL
ncbi:hypothetical protein JAAARDRAFT_147835 [Jaapia argillacea MUCL 33604]|uniref:Tethering factor for nuclear proteasome STS1 n=1 Tax=Jaapia argillacea MUCL 33604 TaxID=933084 RepID=A0A067Q960_9AGAM|nr:hypothetical protein JAAARDRAFT_147835 [Jaapia argillacea MUCL 33604]